MCLRKSCLAAAFSVVQAAMLVGLCAMLPLPWHQNISAAEVDQDDTERTPNLHWDAAHDMPRHVTTDESVKYDYPIVYVRVPRPYPKEYFQHQPPQSGGAASDQCARCRVADAASRRPRRIAGSGRCRTSQSPIRSCRSMASGSISPSSTTWRQARRHHDQICKAARGRTSTRSTSTTRKLVQLNFARAHAEHRRHSQRTWSRIRAAFTTWHRALFPAARLSSVAIATAIAACANKRSRRCNSS